MEDFRRAYQERLLDKVELDRAGRQIAMMHVGGITIECLLKAMRVEIDGIREWHVPGEMCPACRAAIRPAIPQPHGVVNPGHELMQAIQRWPRLWQRLTHVNSGMRDAILQWIRLVEAPLGHFIDLRYQHAISMTTRLRITTRF